MGKFKILTLILLCSNSLFGQMKMSPGANDIFACLIKDKRQVFLLASINPYCYKKIREGLSSNQFIRRITRNDTLYIDTLRISKDERAYIDNVLDSLQFYAWTNANMKLAGLSYFSLVDTTQKRKNPEFNYIVYQIMPPLLIRRNTICFTYYDYSCGALCGQGELSILIKKEGKWQRWWTIYGFVS